MTSWRTGSASRWPRPTSGPGCDGSPTAWPTAGGPGPRPDPSSTTTACSASARSGVALPPVEHRLARALLDRLGTVVTRDALSSAGWPDGAPGRNALDVHVLRLRRRLAPLDLTIHTVRSRGYLLAVSGPRTAASGS